MEPKQEQEHYYLKKMEENLVQEIPQQKSTKPVTTLPVQLIVSGKNGETGLVQ